MVRTPAREAWRSTPTVARSTRRKLIATRASSGCNATSWSGKSPEVWLSRRVSGSSNLRPRSDHKLCLSMGGGKPHPRRRRPGLEEEGRALWRRCDQMRAFDSVARSFVIDAVNLRKVPMQACRAILQQRAIVP